MAEEKELELDVKEIDEELDEVLSDKSESSPVGEIKKTPSRPEQKVELDLDDAPFLEEELEEEKKEEEVKQEIEEKKKEEVSEKEEEDTSLGRKKKIIFLGIGGGVILVAALLFFFFFKGEKAPPKEEKKAPEKKIEVKEKPPPPKPRVEQLTLRPFWVDYPVADGHRYLHITLILSYESGSLSWELNRKRIVIRDAVYYYLKNKNFEFFLKKENIPLLKNDILSIINQYLVYGKIKKIYLKDYLIE
ncbi:hypothetical protein JCM13304A_17760 [Desulfothermus okinawensis JCM 13304]